MTQWNREILAPVGGAEQLLAAVRCGAGAVYLGGKQFNARRNAANFAETDLREAVSYCHVRGVSVYVTVNTVVMDSETEDLEAEAAYIAASGADAVIIQDLSVLRLFSERYPTLKRYASTQTAVHNVDGARFLRDIGFDSVVLARELTLSEMESICAAVPLKVEAFIHGAHCMSVSGACYLSSMLGGRSGNRGLCAQPCRLDWTCGERRYTLSLKDMSLIPHIRQMADAGVHSFKIEGRMKRPEYVAAAVTACKNALEGKPYDTETLRAVFSRNGFTDGYLTGARDGAMFGYRTKEDVTGAEGVLRELAATYRNETPLVAVDLHFELQPDSARLTVSDGVRQVVATTTAPEIAQHRALDEAAACKSLSKTGGTPFYVRAFNSDIADGLMLPTSALNALRRDALDELLMQRGRIVPHPAHPTMHAAPLVRVTPLPDRPALWARFADASQMGCTDAFEKVLLPAEEISPALIDRLGEKLVAQLPTILFPADEAAFSERLAELIRCGLHAVFVNNIYGVALGKRFHCAIHGGFGLNVTNTAALQAYADCGLADMTVSFELSMAKTLALGGAIPRGIVSYGYLPLMHFRNCPVRAAIGCDRCKKTGRLTDRMHIDFPVVCEQQRYSTLLNSVPLDLADRKLAGLDHQLLYFTIESSAQIEAITDRFQRGQKTEKPHTGGLYYRELL